MRYYYNETGRVRSLTPYTFYRKSGEAITFVAVDAREATITALRWGQRRGYKIYRKKRKP